MQTVKNSSFLFLKWNRSYVVSSICCSLCYSDDVKANTILFESLFIALRHVFIFLRHKIVLLSSFFSHVVNRSNFANVANDKSVATACRQRRSDRYHSQREWRIEIAWSVTEAGGGWQKIWTSIETTKCSCIRFIAFGFGRWSIDLRSKYDPCGNSAFETGKWSAKYEHFFNRRRCASIDSNGKVQGQCVAVVKYTAVNRHTQRHTSNIIVAFSLNFWRSNDRLRKAICMARPTFGGFELRMLAMAAVVEEELVRMVEPNWNDVHRCRHRSSARQWLPQIMRHVI